MAKYCIWTIGCQMNRAESERLGSRFEELGFRSTRNLSEADLIIINSCVVRQNAESRVVNKLHNLKKLKNDRPEIIIGLTGCMVTSEVDGLKKAFPYVDYFFKPGEAPPWLENSDGAVPLPLHPSPSVYVPIMQGCNNFCSYCIVPYRRGRERSRKVAEIETEVTELVRRGACEVVLLGQNVDSYGQDLPDRPDLADLLGVLDPIAGLDRIRFLTNHPKDMTEKLVQAVARLDKVCEQVCLPVQSGSDAILKKMNRHYTASDYRRLVQRIREIVPGVAISSDVIVGFPSETSAQFQETVNLLSELKFDTVHVAAYSIRTGTLAAQEYPDDIILAEKKRRLVELENLQEMISADINAGLYGRKVEILIEGKNKGKWYGRTRTDKLVFFSSDEVRPGQLIDVIISHTGPWSLQGKAEYSGG